MKKIFLITTLIWIHSFSLSQNAKVNWYSFNAGFGNTTNQNTKVVSVVDQSLIGSSQTANVKIESGFLSPFSTTIVSVNEPKDVPKSFSLLQNFPNPFNPITTIKFSLAKSTFVSLKVYNIVGEEIARLVSEELQAGNHQVIWNADGFASGVYFYRLQTEEGKFTQVKKLILLK
ncbi:MAG: T9SS type A sorting domain-containing protein [Ignavibacteriales bacterium]|nr:T9SS type A sorting domain-containing protein [Ignavibacteriales bacterium]